jgi:predicted  nucleic acid-binding Zn-ribbon protein
MAINPLEIIAIKKKKIKENEMDTALLCEELGRCVFDMTKFKSVNYCDALITDYSLANDEYIKLKKTQEKFTNIDKNSKSLEKELKIINKNIKDNEKELKELLLRIGAAAYEAYCSNTLPPEIMKLLYSLFDTKQQKVAYLEKKLKSSKSSIKASYYKVRLKKLRLSFIDVFYQTAILLEKNDSIDSLPLKKRTSMLNKYSKYKHTQSELIYSLKIYESELKGLKKDGSLYVKSKLEELRISVNNAHESSKDAATLLGTELYEIIPDDVTSDDIGENSINLIDQITLHKSVIENLNNDIDLLKNEIRIDKIKSQIKEENTNIERLELQIKFCKEKISTIEDTISDKKNKIDILVEEGVYIEEE